MAMALAVASARSNDGTPRFNVIGVDLPTPAGRSKIDGINSGNLPIASTDAKLLSAFQTAQATGNLIATADPAAYEIADVVVVDIHLDLEECNGKPHVDFTGFRAAITELGCRLRPGALVLIETTVPPGTCRKVVAPTLAEALQTRELPADAVLLAHAYERVMPGDQYFDSIVNFWRVYAADSTAAAERCEWFLSQVVNVADYPLTRLGSTVASETAKVLENSYRATTIAFMEEWGRFAEAVGIDLFEVIAAIRRRPTHNNIRQPGFGVGGYCLTKDPLFAAFSAQHLFELPGHSFPFCEQAVATNRDMPLVSLRQVTEQLGGTLQGKHLLLLGISYRQDVGDTRYSPSETFYRAAIAQGAAVTCHDPLVSHWSEIGQDLAAALPAAKGFDAVILAVPHAEYRQQDWLSWLDGQNPLFLDANQVLDNAVLTALKQAGCQVAAIGKGKFQ